MSKGRVYPCQLDSKECWKLWMQHISLQKVQDILIARGVVGRITGRPHNRSAIQKAAWRWLENPENWVEARKDFEYYFRSSGYIPTNEEWEAYIVKAMVGRFQQKDTRLKEWLITNNKIEWGIKYNRNVMARLGLL